MYVDVSTCYVSCGCNRVPHCLDWGPTDLICYGSSNAIVIYNPKVYQNNVGAVIATATGHRDRVNCTRWVQFDAGCRIISTSSDKTAALWQFCSTESKLKIICRFVGHTDVVNVADAVRYSDSQSYCVVTAASNSTIKVWETALTENCAGDTSEPKLKQTIHLKSDFVNDARLAFHPGTNALLLVFGGSDTKVHLYASKNDQLEPVMLLAGHEDWIRAIDITVENDGGLLIASSAQDCFIRIWKLTMKVDGNETSSQDEIKLKDNTYTVETSDGRSCTFVVRLDAVVAGHENWIYGLHWHPRLKLTICDEEIHSQPLKMLTASMDKTMIIWEYDTLLGVWTEKVRVGEVGGNTLGFYGNKFSPDGRSIIAHGYQGALHMWHLVDESGQMTWQPGVTVSGHFREVRDIDWDPQGEFLVSVSSDQTTRLHAPWRCHPQKRAFFQNKTLWYEIARPQVHGYDMTCIAMLGRKRFASGADEKVLRAFEAPKNFVENIRRLCAVDFHDGSREIDIAGPEGASVPALGLSNIAVFDKAPPRESEPKHPKDIYPESYFVATELSEPATEEVLLQNTLWPEVHKLYGHGYEIFCIASSKDGTLLASASKASQEQHACILLWETRSWKNIEKLNGHNLTVTQMEFSPCGKYLLSVSRDRTWSLFSLSWTPDGNLSCCRTAYSNKTNGIHSRIIWTCSWSHDSTFFLTGSRDKKVIVWKDTPNNDSQPTSLGTWVAQTPVLDTADSVTALAVAPSSVVKHCYLIAIGLNDGNIHLYIWKNKLAYQDSWKELIHSEVVQNVLLINQDIWVHCTMLNNIYHHHLTVTRLRFSPKWKQYDVPNNNDKPDSESIVVTLQLASCGTDFSVRIFDVSFTKM